MVWNLRRIALSAFILTHLSAVAIWNLPESALSARLGGWPAYYLMPTGQWQSWEMFAPDPMRETIALEAVVRDAHGRFHQYAFPRTGDRSVLDAFGRYRHAKYSSVIALETAQGHREFAARDVLRRLGLPPTAYPANVELYLKCWPTPEFNGPPADPMVPPRHHTVQVYRFPSYEEAHP